MRWLIAVVVVLVVLIGVVYAVLLDNPLVFGLGELEILPESAASHVTTWGPDLADMFHAPILAYEVRRSGDSYCASAATYGVYHGFMRMVWWVSVNDRGSWDTDPSGLAQRQACGF